MLAERGPALAAQGLPLFVVDAGDLGWKAATVSEAVAEQHRLKLDLQLQAFALAGIDAWTPGEGDLALGLEAVRDSAARHDVPVVAANLRCGGQAPFPAGRVAERGGVRVGIVGLIDPALLGAEGIGGCTAGPVQPALAEAVAALGDVDGLVVLSHQEGTDDGALARSLPRGALVVNGHDRLSHGSAVSLGGGSVQLAAGARGKAIGFAEVRFAAGATGYQGEVAGGDEKRVERFRARLQTAREALAGAGQDELARTRAERQIAFYEREIAELEARLAQASVAEGQALDTVAVSLVDLGKELAEHPETLALVEALKARLGEAGPPAGGPVIGKPGGFAYVGSAACLGCHQAEHAQWQGTAHAGAWASLVEEGRHLDQACWRCHATGAFDTEGPQHPLQVGPPLQGVGCESCHGAGKAHAATPVASNIVRDPPIVTCTLCHDGEQDEGRFDWEKYRPMVLHAGALPGAPQNTGAPAGAPQNTGAP